MHDNDHEQYDQGKSEEGVCPYLFFHVMILNSISSSPSKYPPYPLPAEKISTTMPMIAAVVNPIAATIEISIPASMK
jgi:hypothetical protein